MPRSSGFASILTVCTGNICRSPMAEGIIRKLLGPARPVLISSAGTHALVGNPATEFAVISAFERGVDISGHKARKLSQRLILDSDIILCMEPSHIEWVISAEPSSCRRVYNLADFSGNRKKLKEIFDPYGCSLREFRTCIEDIDLCIRNFLESVDL